MDSTVNTGNGVFNTFTTNRYVSSTREFFNSNSIIAKLSFLLLVLFLFIVLLRLATELMVFFMAPSNTPRLIDGMIDAKNMMVIPQNPSNPGAVNIPRSSNEDEGIEFTWSCWVFIDNLTYNSGQYRCVFYKGNDFSMANLDENQGLNFPNNAPGLYLAPNTNDLVVFMNTFNVVNEKITIKDVPLNKWVNVIIRCQNKTLDVYVNGVITKSHKLQGVPKQNYGDVYVAMNGGFSGYISNLWYYDYALTPGAISNLVAGGPNTKFITKTSDPKVKNADYLSLRWYFFGNTDAYNP